MKPVAVNPRAWNIVAAMCLASGCGGRTSSVDGSSDGSSDASESTESNTTSDMLDTGGPECVSPFDCDGYYCYYDTYLCIDGMCQCGHPHCYTDSDCSTLEICEFGYCQLLHSPPACPAPDPAPGLSIPVAALAMHFVDVDSDGAEELVLATTSELQVYESGSDIPLVSPRGLDSDSIDAMVGGPFDATPGDDVVILSADELRLHASDGTGNFAAPSASASSWPNSVGLLDAELDGAAPADLLIWASSGAGVELGDGDAFPLSVENIGSATARSLADPLGGFVLQHDTRLDFYTVGGLAIGSSEMRGSSPYALTSITQLGESFDLSSSAVLPGPWTIIQQWSPGTGSSGPHWGLLGRVTAMAGGDFDGDARADLALIIDGALQIQFAGLSDETCLAMYPFAAIAQDLAIGDHDGDGDDEIAVRFQGGNIAILEGD
jgi:hypothetical protein